MSPLTGDITTTIPKTQEHICIFCCHLLEAVIMKSCQRSRKMHSWFRSITV